MGKKKLKNESTILNFANRKWEWNCNNMNPNHVKFGNIHHLTIVKDEGTKIHSNYLHHSNVGYLEIVMH
jgi:hypothetical protein